MNKESYHVTSLEPHSFVQLIRRVCRCTKDLCWTIYSSSAQKVVFPFQGARMDRTGLLHDTLDSRHDAGWVVAGWCTELVTVVAEGLPLLTDRASHTTTGQH